MDPQPTILTGRRVRLEPIGKQHAEDLYEFGQDESIWRYLTGEPFTSLERAREWVEMCVGRNETGSRVQFAVMHLAGQSGHWVHRIPGH